MRWCKITDDADADDAEDAEDTENTRACYRFDKSKIKFASNLDQWVGQGLFRARNLNLSSLKWFLRVWMILELFFVFKTIIYHSLDDWFYII